MESRRHVEQWGVWNTANQRRGKLPFQTRGTVLRVIVTHVSTEYTIPDPEDNNRGIPCTSRPFAVGITAVTPDFKTTPGSMPFDGRIT